MARAIAWQLLLQATKDIRTSKSEVDLSVTLVGDRRICLKGADDPETLEGVGLVACVLDEFARMKLDAWEKSLRPTLSDQQGRALFCGKPRGHNHLKEVYDRGQNPKNSNWRSWLFRTIDGGQVPTEDLAEARDSLPEKVYRQEYEASWETMAGRVWDGFARRTHVLPHAELEATYKTFSGWTFRRILLAVDWGFTDPGVFLVIGQTSTGTLVVIHEEYRRGVLVDDSGWLGIAADLHAQYRFDGAVADPSEAGYIKALRAKFGGTPVVYKAQNDIREGIRRVAVQLLPDHAGQPKLLVSDRCTNLIREVSAWVYREIHGAPTEDPVDRDNHTCDALRYGVMELTRGTA
jgi:hypothetical protein